MHGHSRYSNDTREIFGGSRVLRILRILRDACISPVQLFFAEIRDSSQSIRFCYCKQNWQHWKSQPLIGKFIFKVRVVIKPVLSRPCFHRPFRQSYSVLFERCSGDHCYWLKWSQLLRSDYCVLSFVSPFCVLCATQKAVSFANGRLYSRRTAQYTSMAANCSSNWTIEHLSADWLGANECYWAIKHQRIVLWEGDFSTVFQYEWYDLKIWGLFLHFCNTEPHPIFLCSRNFVHALIGPGILLVRCMRISWSVSKCCLSALVDFIIPAGENADIKLLPKP